MAYAPGTSPSPPSPGSHADSHHHRPVKSRALAEDQITSEIERKLAKYAVDGGHGTTLRYRALLAKLKAQPERPAHLSSVLDVLRLLAFTGGAAARVSAKAPLELKRKAVGAVPAPAPAPAQAQRTLAVPSMEVERASKASSGSGSSRPAARESVSARSVGASAREETPRSRRPADAEQRDSRPQTATTDAGSQRGAERTAPPPPEPPGPPAPKAEMLRRWRQSMGECCETR